MRYQQALYDICELSHRVHRKTKDRKTEKQKDRRTQKFFLLFCVLGVLKRRENTKKVGVKKFFFPHESNTWPNFIRAEVKVQ